MGKKEILDELDELLNIPQFERIIFHKIEELKTYLREEISLYRDLKEDFRSAAYGKMHVYEEVKQKKSLTYRFQMDKDTDEKWKITDIEPSPHSTTKIDEILPPLIIKYMASFTTNATRIETVSNFSHPRLEGRTFFLRFAKYSDNHLMGTVTEAQGNSDTGPTDSESGKLVDINDSYKRDDIKFNYRELTHYMEKFPALKEHIFSEFFMRWKPLIDKDLLRFHQ